MKSLIQLTYGYTLVIFLQTIFYSFILGFLNIYNDLVLLLLIGLSFLFISLKSCPSRSYVNFILIIDFRFRRQH